MSSNRSQAFEVRQSAGGGQAFDQPASELDAKPRMRWRGSVGQFKPAMSVLGALAGAGIAKTGYGAWAAGAIAVSVPVYFGFVATAMLTCRLGKWIARTKHFEAATLSSKEHGDVTTNPSNRQKTDIRRAAAQTHCVCWKRAA